MPRRVEAVGVSDAGSVRQFNEDRIVLAPEIGVVALADGMGGHRAGEIASHMAADLVVDSMRTHFAAAGATATQHSPLLALDKSINQANRQIFDAAQASWRAWQDATCKLEALGADPQSAAAGFDRACRIRTATERARMLSQ